MRLLKTRYCGCTLGRDFIYGQGRYTLYVYQLRSSNMVINLGAGTGSYKKNGYSAKTSRRELK